MSLLDIVFEPLIEPTVITNKSIFKSDTGFDGDNNEFSKYPVLTMTPYVDPVLDTEFTTKKYTDDNFLSQTDASSTYLTQTNATNTYLSQADASNTYLSQANATSTYLSQADASNTYLSQANASNTYLTQANATNTYLTQANATNTYLSQANATSTYLTQANASNTYLTQTAASNTYLTQAVATTELALKASESFVTSSINTAINNLINSAPSTLDTLGEIATILQSNVNDIGTLTTSIAGKVSKTANETISGVLTFTQAPIMSGASITSATIPDTALVSTFLKTSDASSTYLTQANATNTYLSQANASSTYQPILTNSAFLDATSSVQTQLNAKAPIASPALTGVPTAPTPSTSDNSTQLATTAYVKSNLTSYQPTLTGSSNITVGTLACSTLTPSSLITATRLTEVITAVSGSSPYTLNFALGNVFFLSGTQPSANFTCNITNIPTGGTNNQYTITLLYNSSTACFCNTASATDTSSGTIVASGTPKYVNNTAPTLSNSSVYIQTFSVVQCFSTKFILTTVSTFN